MSRIFPERPGEQGPDLENSGKGTPCTSRNSREVNNPCEEGDVHSAREYEYPLYLELRGNAHLEQMKGLPGSGGKVFPVILLQSSKDTSNIRKKGRHPGYAGIAGRPVRGEVTTKY